eukprot:TRINITY_DN19447_c0_g1_i1.p1 TRINITY_DN19447_c0_g1~~TRINITY_DN19447_c0_g1_i1.p1  ORF type:complete len:130 (+),score=20.51 TRINITY_DN19447_c0_g1_i1:130-519(+)
MGVCFSKRKNETCKASPFQDVKFLIEVEYCEACGGAESVDLIRERLVEEFPKAECHGKPEKRQNGAFEVTINMDGVTTLLHSNLKGEGWIADHNQIEILILKIRSFLQEQSSIDKLSNTPPTSDKLVYS